MEGPSSPDDLPGGKSDWDSVPPRLLELLRLQHGGVPAVPPELDARVLARARAEIAPEARSRIPRVLALPTPFWRWAPALASAAALVLLLWSASVHRRPIPGIGDAARMDVDGNGRVDIRDGFRVARGLGSGEALDPQWDVDGDGRVTQRDVDLIARAAVAIEGKWAR